VTQVLDRETGQIVDVPEAELADGVRSGRYGLRKGTTVAVVDPTGRLGTISAEEAATAFSSGFRPTTHAEVRTEDLRLRYGGIGQTALAGAEGLARGASVGLSDPMLVSLLGDEYRKTAAERQEAKPILSTGSEIVGAVIPALLTRGATAEAQGAGIAARLARAATLPTRTVTRVGAMAEAATAQVMGTGAKSAVGRIAQRAAPSMVEGLVSGALDGAGRAISEASLGGHEITAERLLAGAGHGALLGGFAGGVLSGGAQAIKEAAKRVGGGAQGPGTLKLIELYTGKKFTTASDALEDFAKTRALKSTGGLQKEMLALERLPPAYRDRAAEMLLRDLPQISGSKSLAKMSRAQIHDASDRMQERAGKAIGDALKSIDDTIATEAAGALIELQPDVIGVVEKARRQVDALRSRAGAGPMAKKFDAYLDDLLDKATGSGFKDLHSNRVFLDTQIKWAKQNSDPSHDTWKAIRGIIEGEIETKADVAAKAIGIEATYKAAKRDYAAAKWVTDASAKGLLREGTNRTISLGDHLFGVAGGIVGGSLGPVVSMASAGASAAVSNLVRNRGDQVAAAVAYDLASRAARKEATIAALAKVSQRTDAKLAAGVNSYLARLTAAPMSIEQKARTATTRAIIVANPRKVYEEKRAQIAEARANPEGTKARIERSTRAMAETAPNVTAALHQRTMAGVDFLESKLPKTGGSDLWSHLRKDAVPHSELQRFARYAAAVEDPTVIVDELEAGRLSPETVEAVKAVAPELFGQVQQSVMTGLSNVDSIPPYSERVQLGILLEIPADESLQPEMLARLGQPLAQPDNKPAPNRGGGGRRKTARALMSEMDRLSEGEED
jgi:hypothetical protein